MQPGKKKPPLGLISDGFNAIPHGDVSPRLIKLYRPTVKEGLAEQRPRQSFASLVLKDLQTGGRFTPPFGIFSPQPLSRKQD